MMGQKNPQVTWRHYYRLFDKSSVAERVRAAQSRITDLYSCAQQRCSRQARQVCGKFPPARGGI